MNINHGSRSRAIGFNAFEKGPSRDRMSVPASSPDRGSRLKQCILRLFHNIQDQFLFISSLIFSIDCHVSIIDFIGLA